MKFDPPAEWAPWLLIFRTQFAPADIRRQAAAEVKRRNAVSERQIWLAGDRVRHERLLAAAENAQ